MKALRSRASARLPVRPLACAVVLALVTLSSGELDARQLNGESAEVTEGDAAEVWRLINGSHLAVSGGETYDLTIEDTSSVQLRNATVRRNTEYGRAAALSGNASLVADSTSFIGAVSMANASSLRLSNSHILHVPGAGVLPGDLYAVGLTIGSRQDAQAIVDSTLIQVAFSDADDEQRGVGIVVAGGQLDLINRSRVEASNIGLQLMGSIYGAGSTRVNIDASTIVSGLGAAIEVSPASSAISDYDITVANGSTLVGGDGHLLRVRPWSGVTDNGYNSVRFTVDDSRLAGDILFENDVVSGTLDVTLRNHARIDGRFINVTSASVASGSTWLMTGDSNVGQLTLANTGTVALGNGSTFNTLAVDDFIGAGGTLLFNTQLGDDSSATDRLVISGDANGQANVRVLNAGGAGAKTDKGIELIRIGGASNAQFDLLGRAVGGQYEYFLFKDESDGGWYLRSELAGSPDPCVIDPSLPECNPIDPVDPTDPSDPGTPTPVLRPEAGAYLANQFAAHQLLRHGWRDRQGGRATDDGVHGWARADGTQSRLAAVQEQLDLHVDRSRLQLGADAGVFDSGRGRVGLMATLAQSSATSRSQLTGYSARGKVEGGAVGAYGSWSRDALYLDASMQRGQFRNRVQGEGLAEEQYDSDIWQSSLEAGYRFGIGQIGSTGLSLQPELQLVYTDVHTDRHEEANGTVVRSLGGSGLSGRVGLRLQGEGHSGAGASVSPYVVANWYRDGASNGMAFDDDVLQASVPRNRYELNAGARVDFRSGLSGWGGFGVMRGDHGYREATANVGVAYRW